MAAVKRLPVHHHGANYFFVVPKFGIIEFMFNHLKIEFRLSRCYGARPVLHISLLVMSRLSKTEFAIFVSLMWSLLPRDQIF